jgi:hypothetical protein
LVNLHVHSKDLRIFRNIGVSSRNIKKYLSKRSKGEFVEFKSIVFTRQLGKKFHKEFNEYCQTILNGEDKDYFGSDPTGYYYKERSDIEVEAFKTTTRWLNVYLTAVALGYDIRFG